MKQHTIGARILAAFLPVAGAIGLALPASADIPPVLANAAMMSTKLGSYHLTMTTTIGGQTTTSVGDVQTLSPLKMRMTVTGGPTGQMQMVIIAPTSYMKMGNTPWKKYPGDASDFAQMNVASMIAKDKNNYVVTDLGMQLKDGQMLHAYKLLNKTKNSTQTIFLDRAGRFARMEMDTMTMQFSNYGEPLNIAPPM
jgi:outer membrane lipoprotein-sorting protein